jgi:hypothetical protein
MTNQIHGDVFTIFVSRFSNIPGGKRMEEGFGV